MGQAEATHRGVKEGLLEEAHRPPTPPGSLLCPLGTPQLLDLRLAYPNLVGLTLTVPSLSSSNQAFSGAEAPRGGEEGTGRQWICIFDARSGESLD